MKKEKIPAGVQGLKIAIKKPFGKRICKGIPW
jgi:hypothetical protein